MLTASYFNGNCSRRHGNQTVTWQYLNLDIFCPETQDEIHLEVFETSSTSLFQRFVLGFQSLVETSP